MEVAARRVAALLVVDRVGDPEEFLSRLAVEAPAPVLSALLVEKMTRPLLLISLTRSTPRCFPISSMVL